MDRKARIREYKEAKRPMGVFRVRNVVSGRWLIGRSVDLPAALNRQRAQLRLRAHPNRVLQADWNELGAASFAFEVLDTLTPSDAPGYDPAVDLQALEAMWEERLSAEEVSRYDRK